ncbi:MAG: NAD+ synthase [Henriciella sp.]|jgi:NAD+ synthase|uniref:NAD+ synthase n=1 Tax=Henriciella sp. TaxID=1968823 RepID=UPI000C0C7B55|nr:NAD+ synthase [Henriciella sp.]MAN73792.1 NAD+ synthase [Henriciella sp.]MBF35531.1 NAD+ synthase [Hyphomonadaceae bacterium]PHR82429.1 MAG: NAD+ synthase [Henriciella sp.]|tara:strand:- start:14872 stop:16530 length:1659 start_codon:yes stop_codon:yes gene_type:complete
MSDVLKILAAQLNPVVGDIDGNAALARDTLKTGADEGADLVVFAEMFILGYPPEDLVLKPSAVELCMKAVETLARDAADGPSFVIGAPWREDGKLFNSILFCRNGAIEARYDKQELPNYGVFDEQRLFDRGESPACIIEVKGAKLALAICEDVWFDRVPNAAKAAGAELLVIPNGSPWRRSIHAERAGAFDRWSRLGLPYIFINQVGGQDELVFDGGSYATNSIHAERCGLVGQFETGTAVVEFDLESRKLRLPDAGCELDPDGWHMEYRAATLALGDYVNKNRFPGVVLGMSGGIDSALTAAIAVDALGPDRVWCVMMPSRYTSSESLEDAKKCAEALGVRYDIINIAPGVGAMDEMLADLFAGRESDTTEENIQSRLRGLTLMALSNKFGHMVVTTGNKSEMAVGYATLYGDMCGGYNALKDFYKTEVFELSRWRNANLPKGALGPSGEVIPERIITKPPSAELREDQKDEDSLPSYDDLDDILRGLVDAEEDIDDIVGRGHDEATVRRIEHLLYIAEYKRRQAPPGVKVGGKNFGRDRRYPITNRFRDD